jgi:hypothetical protein
VLNADEAVKPMRSELTSPRDARYTAGFIPSARLDSFQQSLTFRGWPFINSSIAA